MLGDRQRRRCEAHAASAQSAGGASAWYFEDACGCYRLLVAYRGGLARNTSAAWRDTVEAECADAVRSQIARARAHREETP